MMLNKRNWWNVAAVATLALVALFAVAPASAQEQVGAIQGTVSDASGAVLPGATVEAVSAGGTRLSGTTNESGAYRFPRVPPGTYVVVARLDGFNPAEVQNVAVGLGGSVTANITLEVGAVSETISVVGEAGQVDVKSSATAASISAEQIELLPKGRDFTGVATQAAGAANEGFDKNVKPLNDRITFLDNNGTVAPGITGMNAFGHSPGHMVYHLESDGQRLMITADTANHYVWSLQKPDWEVRFDADKPVAATVRKQVFGMIAADRIPFIGYHMPFPGTGFIEARDDGFRFVPASYQLMLNG